MNDHWIYELDIIFYTQTSICFALRMHRQYFLADRRALSIYFIEKIGQLATFEWRPPTRQLYNVENPTETCKQVHIHKICIVKL